jgi:limonene-1,2-epoxide hydrolase
MPDSPIEIAKTFIAHWNADRMEEALAMLSDDVLYDNVPFPTIIGRDGVRKFHVDFGSAKTSGRTGRLSISRLPAMSCSANA